MARKNFDYLLDSKSPAEVLELARLGRRSYDARRQEARRQAQMKFWAKKGLEEQAQQGQAQGNA